MTQTKKHHYVLALVVLILVTTIFAMCHSPTGPGPTKCGPTDSTSSCPPPKQS